MPKPLSALLGREYMDQFYKGALFLRDGYIHSYAGHITASTILTKRISAQPGNNDGWQQYELPTSEITDMSAFAWPQLGYRNIQLKPKFSGVFHMSSIRSAMRGLKSTSIMYEGAPITNLLCNGNMPTAYVKIDHILREVYAPKFPKYREALQQLDQNKHPCLAIHRDFAIGIPVSRAGNDPYDVYYKNAACGVINSNGQAVLTQRLRKRHSVYRLFEGEVVL